MITAESLPHGSIVVVGSKLTSACDLDFSLAVDITGGASQLYNLIGASALPNTLEHHR